VETKDLEKEQEEQLKLKVDGLEPLWCRSVESFKSHFSDAKVEGNEVYL
jgi:hypothetical protein